MNDNTIERKIINKLSAEDVVIVITIVITLLLSATLPILWFLKDPILVPPTVISVFLGIAVSALLYRFLGGVHDASFGIGALKVTGAAAVLIFIAWWANDELRKHIEEVVDLNETFDIAKHSIPSSETWYAVDHDSGNPVKLEFRAFNQVQNPPSLEELNSIRENVNLNLKNVNNKIVAYQNNGVERVLGKISEREINELGFFNGENVQFMPYRVVKLGASDREDINGDLPFVIETRGFSEEYTRFALISRDDGKDIKEGAIFRWGAEVFEVQGRYYLVSVVQVNHNPKEVAPYAKLYVAEIRVVHTK